MVAIEETCGLPTSAIPSSTEMARMMSAEYGGMRKGNSYLVRVRVRARAGARARARARARVRGAEGELVRDLRQVGSELLEVDALGAATRERDVEDLGEGGHDGRRVDLSRDEVHVLEVLADERVVSVDQVRDRLDHAVLLVVRHL